MRFYNLEKKHYQEVATHYVETFNAPPWNDSWTCELVLVKLDEIMNSVGGYGLYCSDAAGDFVGAVFGNSEIFYNCKQFFIKELFVTLKLQGMGSGKLIMNELEKRLKKMDINKIYLFTGKGGPAQSFYEKDGFYNMDKMVLMGKNI